MLHPFPDSLSRLRTALRRKRDNVTVLNSNLVKDFFAKLLEQGLVSSFNVLDIKKLSILLKYMFGDSVISTIINFYRPSNRFFLRLFHIHSAIMKSSISMLLSFVVSTNFGLLTDTECRMFGIGGYLIAAVG